MKWTFSLASLAMAATLLVGQAAFAIDISSRTVEASFGSDNSTAIDSNGRLVIRG